MLQESDLQELLQYEASKGPIVSLYLNADVTQQSSETVKLHARALLKDLGCDADDEVAIENYLDFSHDWGKPGLAIFSAAKDEFFRTYSTAVVFRNRARVGTKPYLKPLTHLLDHYAHYGVIVVDRIGARFFEYHLGELEDSSGTMGDDVRKQKLGGGSSRGGGTTSATGQRGGQGGRHEEEVIQRNMRETAAVAEQFFLNKPIRRLFLGGTAENVAQLREFLSKKLQSCIAGTFAIDMTAGEHEVRKRSLELLEEVNTERERKLVSNMITTAAKGGNAVVGLDPTLNTVSTGRVQTLIISDGYKAPGYSDENHHFLSARPNTVEAIDQDQLIKVDDVVEAAVSRTMALGGSVEIITDNQELDEAGQIGALLRY